MPRIRVTLARSEIDRDLQTHLGRAATAVRAAMGVCGRAARSQRRGAESPYRDKQKQLARAEKMLSDIGHLEGATDTPDMRSEARALCSWLESRERRVAGAQRASRRGQEYQNRLQQVLQYMAGGDTSSSEKEPEKKVVVPEDVQEPEQGSEGVLWNRALGIARQQNKGEDDAYVLAIFVRLTGGSETDG